MLRGLANTVARLTANRRSMHRAAGSGSPLGELTGFGSNPGNLVARTFLPSPRGDRAPLVVALHGCTQNPAAYDNGSGWSHLAQREGFALLFPEQQRANNSNMCFNWYLADDARRDRGEALSISQMITHMTVAHGLDPTRVYITGLSAGGAMTSVMLATYPELFAGGAIIAGIPFASANSLPEALARMRGQGSPGRRQLAARARAAGKESAALPTLSVWHGTQDTIVDPINAVWIVDQWRDLHGIGTKAGITESVGQHRREVWCDDQGREVIERYDVVGMGHGTPLATRASDSCGLAGPHMLEANICSTRSIAAFWGLINVSTLLHGPDRVAELSFADDQTQLSPFVNGPTNELRTIIEDALRSAGLMQ